MNKDQRAAFHVKERLMDQRYITIRAVRADDKGLVIESSSRVSADSLYSRLFTVKTELSASDLKKITEVDFVNVVALVALLEIDGRDQIVGGGRYIRSGASEKGPRAEVAFLVDDPFQGIGIASLIFKHLLQIARVSGIAEFEAEVLPSNMAMFRVFAQSGIPVIRTARDYSIHLLMDLTGEEGCSGSSHSSHPDS